MPKNSKTAHTSSIFSSFKRKHRAIVRTFDKKHYHARRWFEQKGIDLASIRAHSAKTLAGATLGSALLLASPNLPQLHKTPSSQLTTVFQKIEEFTAYLHELFRSNQLNPSDEKAIIAHIRKFFGVSVQFELQGNRIPTYLGKMGLEQHLARFPGDTIGEHQAFLYEGMAPGLGAFRHFKQPDIPKEKAEENERFYVVLQTFLIPDWNRNWATLQKFYRFRKFLVINPENGHAVVAVLGDSGPATWTGKQFGGSPEVMAGLGFLPRKTKGDVVVLFLDDPEDTIPLGPLAPKPL